MSFGFKIKTRENNQSLDSRVIGTKLRSGHTGFYIRLF